MFSSVLAVHLLCAVVTVRPGDTLSQIAATHQTTWQTIYADNRMRIRDPNLIYPGQQLTICSHHATLSPPAGPVTDRHVLSSVLRGQPCQSAVMWPVGSVSMWETPVSCYGGIYYGGHGDCFGWVKYLRPGVWRRIGYPVPGSVVYFPPGAQGASAAGHYAYILSVRRGWALVSEENMDWRGGGYNRISYRYVLLTSNLIYYQ